MRIPSGKVLYQKSNGHDRCDSTYGEYRILAKFDLFGQEREQNTFFTQQHLKNIADSSTDIGCNFFGFIFMVADKSVYSLNYGFKKSSNHKKVSLRIFVFLFGDIF